MAAVFRMFTIISALLARTNMAATGKGHRARVSRGCTHSLVSTHVQTYTNIHGVMQCRGGRWEKMRGDQGWLEERDRESDSKWQSGSKKERERACRHNTAQSWLGVTVCWLVNSQPLYTKTRAKKWMIAQEWPFLTYTLMCSVLWICVSPHICTKISLLSLSKLMFRCICVLMDVSYLEKIDGNIAKIHWEFEEKSSRELPCLGKRI